MNNFTGGIEKVRRASVVGIVLICVLLAPGVIFAQEEKKESQELLDRIDALERQIRKLEEEGKARKSLEVTEEEKVQTEKEVLEAVSREYTLDPQGTLALDYNLSYAYSPSETITTAEQQLQLQRESDHTITHSIYTSYSIRDNISANVTLPILYRYNKMGTEDELDETDIGDISFGAAYQPIKSEAGDVRSTVSFGAVLPTGRSPYKINPNAELSTGGGLYQLNLGASFSKQVDPVVMFWTLGITYPFKKTGLNYRVLDQVTLTTVDPGMSFSATLGMGYSLSYANSINMSFNYQYAKSTTLTYKELTSARETGDRVSASFGIGMGIRATQKTTVSVSLGYSLTDESFTLSTRVPFSFVL